MEEDEEELLPPEACLGDNVEKIFLIVDIPTWCVLCFCCSCWFFFVAVLLFFPSRVLLKENNSCGTEIKNEMSCD